MKVIRRARLRSSIYYAIAMAISAVYCYSHSEAYESFALIAASASVFAAFALGYWLGDWYVPVQGESPRSELVACPVLVSLLAPILGSMVVLLFASATSPEFSAGEVALWLLPMSAYGTLAYFSFSWPAIGFSFSIAGLALARSRESA